MALQKERKQRMKDLEKERRDNERVQLERVTLEARRREKEQLQEERRLRKEKNNPEIMLDSVFLKPTYKVK